MFHVHVQHVHVFMLMFLFMLMFSMFVVVRAVRLALCTDQYCCYNLLQGLSCTRSPRPRVHLNPTPCARVEWVISHTAFSPRVQRCVTEAVIRNVLQQTKAHKLRPLRGPARAATGHDRKVSMSAQHQLEAHTAARILWPCSLSTCPSLHLRQPAQQGPSDRIG